MYVFMIYNKQQTNKQKHKHFTSKCFYLGNQILRALPSKVQFYYSQRIFHGGTLKDLFQSCVASLAIVLELIAL